MNKLAQFIKLISSKRKVSSNRRQLFIAFLERNDIFVLRYPAKY